MNVEKCNEYKYGWRDNLINKTIIKQAVRNNGIEYSRYSNYESEKKEKLARHVINGKM